MKKTKEESTSSGARKKKSSSSSGGRLTDMLESMQKRSSPVNAHKVATKYFDDFKKDRQIPEQAHKEAVDTAVNTGEDTAVTTAVDSAVISAEKKQQAKKQKSPRTISEDPLLNRSEDKVYSVMRNECLNAKTDSMRFGLKELKEKTGLSDKTIRVAIHALEKKLNVIVQEPSLGIYGRKFKVVSPDEVKEKREKRGIEIDAVTKRVVADNYRGK